MEVRAGRKTRKRQNKRTSTARSTWTSLMSTWKGQEDSGRSQHGLQFWVRSPARSSPRTPAASAPMLTSQSFYSGTSRGTSQTPQMTSLSAGETLSPGNRRSPWEEKHGCEHAVWHNEKGSSKVGGRGRAV